MQQNIFIEIALTQLNITLQIPYCCTKIKTIIVFKEVV